MIGIKRHRDEDDDIKTCWVKTDDLEDAALPSDEFIWCESPSEAHAKLRERFPNPDGTHRIRTVGPDSIHVHAIPVLNENIVRLFGTRHWEKASSEQAASLLAALVETCGKITVMVDRSTTQRWQGINRHDIEGVDFHGGTLFIPVTKTTLKRRERARKGVATKSRRLREHLELEDLKIRTTQAALGPVVSAFDTFVADVTARIKTAFEKADIPLPLPYMGQMAVLTRWHDFLTKKSYRTLGTYKQAMRACDAAVAYRDKFPYQTRKIHDQWVADREARKAKRQKKIEQPVEA